LLSAYHINRPKFFAFQVSKAEYLEHGSVALAQNLADQLRSDGLNPYVIPVGGSNALGCWGYMMALQEIVEQWQDKEPFTHICVVSMQCITSVCVSYAAEKNLLMIFAW
jgi:1-aminocyclopropane-1-carboxylate deaminase/D-cysteine desulfhydrase-like pyridoxal-dependent ACC family enzyme